MIVALFVPNPIFSRLAPLLAWLNTETKCERAGSKNREKKNQVFVFKESLICKLLAFQGLVEI